MFRSSSWMDRTRSLTSPTTSGTTSKSELLAEWDAVMSVEYSVRAWIALIDGICFSVYLGWSSWSIRRIHVLIMM